MSPRVLIVEDDRDLARVLQLSLRQLRPDCRVELAASGAEALAQAETEPPDLVVLDVRIPPPDGFEVCRRIRETSRVPILMLTVRDATLDKVRALDLGADDYLTKPFDHLELLARLRALLRRGNGSTASPDPDLALGDLSLDFATHEVRVGGEVVPFTSTEYHLLEVLARHAGTVLPHQFLLERVWGPEYTRDAHYLKVFVRRLRQKLGDDAERPRYIRTAWGTGYRFIAPREAQAPQDPQQPR